MANDSGFSIEGWAEFVETWEEFVENWEAKKELLLRRMGEIYHAGVIPHVPVDTSTLVDHIFVYDDGIPLDYIEVGTNTEYAVFVNEGHVQHRRFLPAEKLTVGGKTKYLKNADGRGIMLREKYIPGKFFMEKGLNDAKPKLERLIESFMEDIAREVEGGKL